MGVAGWALVFSVAAIGWQVLATWIRWPRVAVVMRQGVVVGQTSGGYTAHLIVVNSGAEAATIANAGIYTDDPSVQRFDIEYQRDNGVDIDGPELPARIEAHGCLVFKFPNDQLAYIRPGDKYGGYAQRYKRFRRWFLPSRQTPIREYTTNRWIT
ncbi:hypothetical protein [Antrihabitans stalactiti]|uniref:Uncharacterized protein n=1 Tax=Antrihabitans stalactiti TaxID=2584121 RepID=A0A848KCY4_9NOCA|nr:hypothetical protein [Antrihabitans stalactiti]NMN93907.1 hypothetical protein [Antrihabitans stalactiti]